MLWLAKGLPHRSALLRIVPLAGLNSCVLGTVLVERTQSFTLGQMCIRDSTTTVCF